MLSSESQHDEESAYNTHMEITLNELEDAVNYWRLIRPSRGEESALSSEVNALATDYALMIFNGKKSMTIEEMNPLAQQLVASWREQSQPHSPADRKIAAG